MTTYSIEGLSVLLSDAEWAAGAQDGGPTVDQRIALATAAINLTRTKILDESKEATARANHRMIEELETLAEKLTSALGNVEKITDAIEFLGNVSNQTGAEITQLLGALVEETRKNLQPAIEATLRAPGLVFE
jgi:hypothetical protein